MARIAAMVFEHANGDGDAVKPFYAASYYANAAGHRLAPGALRAGPLQARDHGLLLPGDWRELLDAYMDELLAEW